MKLPRDVSGADLVKALRRLGYELTRTSGSHARLSCGEPREHHITIPLHDPIRLGTLAAIVADLCEARQLERDELLARLFDR